MSLNSTHPSYERYIEDWRLMRDAYEGERVVKAAGVRYLPPTPGQLIDGMGKVTKAGKTNLGQESYDAYKMRAVFHDYVSDAVEAYIGMLHTNPAAFELPDGMEPLIDKITVSGESLATLLRRINEQQLVTGRVGLLLDMPENPDPTNPMPYIATYNAEVIRNWDDSADNSNLNSLTLVVLDETGFERDSDFNWVSREKYRVLQLGDTLKVSEDGETTEVDTNAPKVYQQGLFHGTQMVPEKMVTPVLRGQPLEQIPFVFINSKDVISAPDNPPLLGLGNLAMTIYRGEADYRYQLFMQGQDTLVVIGGLMNPTSDPLAPSDATRVGAGSTLEVNLNGDAKYIGVESNGLSEVRSALENDKQRAETKAGQLATKNTGQKESGEALKTRLGAQTATLMQIALSSAAGLENILKVAAVWMGKDPEKVKVIPNLEFAEVDLDSKSLVDMVTARNMGAPLAFESIHKVMVERGMTELTYEEEMAKIEEEDAGAAKRNEKLGLDPTGAVIPEPDPNAPPGGGNPPGSA